MIKFSSLRQYTHVVNGIRYPQKAKEPFILVYYSENSTLIEDYPKLNILNVDARYAIVPVTKIPRSRIDNEIKMGFKSLRLIALSSTQKIPSGKNIILDLSLFLRSIDDSFKPANYRQRAGFLIQNILQKAFAGYPSNYQKVLIYSVDPTKKVNSFINRKVFPIFQQLKDEQFLFDHMVFSVVNETSSMHRLLVKNKKFKLAKIKVLLKNLKIIDIEDDKTEEINKVTKSIIKNVVDDINPKNKKKIEKAISDYVTKDDKTREAISNEIDSEEDDLSQRISNFKLNRMRSKEIATAAILHQTNGDLDKSKRMAKAVPEEKKSRVLKTIDKQYADELLERKKPESGSTEIAIKLANVEKLVGQKSPEHLFEKRKIDFSQNLQRDMQKSFKVLETKDIPLKVISLVVKDKKVRKGELQPSDISIIQIKLQDKDGKKHNVSIDIPNIQDDGTFKISGRKKCLIHQMVLCPITFPKPFDSKFESSYSAFHINSKRTKREKHLQVFIAACKLPLSVVMFFSFGFEETLKQFGIGYKITDQVSKDNKYFTKINKEKYISFSNIDSELREEFCKSFIRHDFSAFETSKEFATNMYWNDVIIEMTGRVNSTFLLQSNLENIVDPVVKQILINKQLPYELSHIMMYMATKAVEGFQQARNDVSNQRIRNSEVIVHLAQKQILAAYTEYKEKILSGNVDAEFVIPESKVMSDFVNSEIVTDMEYANPAEELSTMTRVSPVGKSIGGIPDKGAVTNEGRDVHPSMFGNIDTLDTPEGENIGIVQHLTLDAYITSARGLIIPKELKENENTGLLSTAAAMIPWVNHDDGARVMFGCNQSRQSVPLKNPEPPGVQSGYESILVNMLSSAFIKKAPCNGKIISVDNDFIRIKCNDGAAKEINVEPEHLKSGSGKNTLSVFKPTIVPGQSVKKGKIIAEGSSITDGTISMGRSLCVALTTWKGYNFEDGIVISDSLIKSGKLTSLHGIVEEVLISENDRLIYINEINKITEKGEPLLRKTIGEVEELLGFEEGDNEDIFSGQMIKKSPGGKIVDIEVFANIKLDDYPQLKYMAAKTDKKYGKPSNEKFTVKGNTIKGILVKFQIEQEIPIGIGDKLTNRHGAKGIVSLIEKEEDMPMTPWGERVEIITNPIGVINRMNMGQYYELYGGLIGKELGIQILKIKNQKKTAELLKKVMSILDMSKNKEFSNKLVSGIASLSTSNFSKFLNQIEKYNRFPIVVPAFKSPSHKELIAAMKVLGLKTGYKLKLTEYNTYTYTEVPVGYQYFLKLEHIGSEKIHSRSTGPVTSKTGQPTAGKKREGGQRMGEMDSYSLISYNCPTTLSEFFGPLSDDPTTKNEMLSNIVQNGSTEFMPAKHTPAIDLLNAYFTAMVLEKK